MEATRSSTSNHSKASSLGNILIQVHQEWEYEAESTFATEMEKKKLDPQVLLILEHIGELYTEQKGILKRLFEGSHNNNTWEVIKKLKDEAIQIRLRKRDAKVLTRSLSVGSPRRSFADNVTRLDRFKIRTLDVKQGGGEGGPQLGGSN